MFVLIFEENSIQSLEASRADNQSLPGSRPYG